MITINVPTRHHEEFVDITGAIREKIREYGWNTGLLTVYCPHTTAAITINENADPDVPADIISHLAKLVPQNANFKHSEGNSDGHIKSSLVGASEQVIVHSGEMVLGTWQAIFFCEFDGPRQRTVYLHFRAD